MLQIKDTVIAQLEQKEKMEADEEEREKEEEGRLIFIRFMRVPEENKEIIFCISVLKRML